MHAFLKSLILPVAGITVFSAFYFSVAIFQVDEQLVEQLDQLRNPLLDLPPRTFFDEAYPIVANHPNGNDCASLWSTGDPGSADCRLLAARLAEHFATVPSSVIDQQVWARYFVENSRAITRAIINS